jgi:hypothetical protein
LRTKEIDCDYAEAGGPFLMIVAGLRTPAGWKMASDVALPIPPPLAGQP